MPQTESREQEKKTGFTPDNIVNSECLFDVKLSPDAKQLLYHVKPLFKSGEHETCAIWLGDVGQADSARQFTSGLFNDHAARFHPNGKKLLFLSDRHKAGGPAQVYSIALDGGEAYSLFGKDNKRGVSDFEISPDGRYIAFTSQDEPTPEDERQEKEKDDPQVFGDKRKSHFLRLYNFATGVVRTLHADKGAHVDRFLWTSDSKSLVYLTRENSALEFTQHEVKLSRIAIAVGAQPEPIGNYPRSPSLCLLPTGEIVSIQSYEPGRISDSKAVFIHSAKDFSKTERLYGKMDDAVRVVDLMNGDLFAVEVAYKLDTRIEVPREHDPDSDKGLLFRTSQDAIGREKSSWDARKRPDGTYVMVAIKSSSSRREPPNVWTGTSDHLSSFCSLETKISSHLKWMTEGPDMVTELFSWTSKDDECLYGIVTYPPAAEDGKAVWPLPTVLRIHGGPYSRVTHEFAPAYANWQHLLAAQGYLVISPNYRGGQGHGSEFARAAHGGMGTVDWSDCESMLEALIDLGIADGSRVGIGGWSQGGFLTAWGVGKTKNRFKAAVMGAGVSDWGMLAATSDLPDFEVDLAGCAPWDTANPEQRSDIHGSPIGHVTGVETAVLILHGEKDERVPTSQGITFFRGLRRRSKYPERAQLVIYPREPHTFSERNHARDVLKRVVEHFTTWI